MVPPLKSLLIRSAMSRFTRSLGRSLAGRFVPVFMMHRVSDKEGRLNTAYLAMLRKQLEYIRREGYRPMPVEDVLQLLRNGEPLPLNAVSFTVDDGFLDQAEHLGPLFAEFDIPLTYFLISDFLERRLWSWDDQLHYILTRSPRPRLTLTLPDGSEAVYDTDRYEEQFRPLRNRLKKVSHSRIYDWMDVLYEQADVERPDGIPESFAPMSWQDARCLQQQGHYLAPHTRSHRILSQLQPQEVEEEIIGSCDMLEQRLEHYSPVFAYPTGRLGDFGEREMDFLATTHLLGAVSTVPGPVTRDSHPWAAPRYSMPGDFDTFLQYLDYIEAFNTRLRQG